MKVRDVMSEPAQTCHVHTDVATASRRMKECATGMLVVLDDRGKAKGVVTDRDLALLIGQGHGGGLVKTAMSHRLHTCDENDDLHQALATMAAKRVCRLPVMSDGELRAVLSIDDIILWAVRQGGITPRELASALRTICGGRAVPEASEPAPF